MLAAHHAEKRAEEEAAPQQLQMANQLMLTAGVPGMGMQGGYPQQGGFPQQGMPMQGGYQQQF